MKTRNPSSVSKQYLLHLLNENFPEQKWNHTYGRTFTQLTIEKDALDCIEEKLKENPTNLLFREIHKLFHEKPTKFIPNMNLPNLNFTFEHQIKIRDIQQQIKDKQFAKTANKRRAIEEALAKHSCKEQKRNVYQIKLLKQQEVAEENRRQKAKQKYQARQKAEEEKMTKLNVKPMATFKEINNFYAEIDKLKRMVKNNILMAISRKTKFFDAKIPRDLQELENSLLLIEKDPEKTKYFLREITKSAERMGKNHPLCKQARQCEGLASSFQPTQFLSPGKLCTFS